MVTSTGAAPGAPAVAAGFGNVGRLLGLQLAGMLPLPEPGDRPIDGGTVSISFTPQYQRL